MRFLRITYCSDQSKEFQLTDDDELAIEVWKELADELLLGKPTKAFGLMDGHVVRVSTVVVPDLDPNDPGYLELSVYRTCEDIHKKEAEPKLYVTGGI